MTEREGALPGVDEAALLAALPDAAIVADREGVIRLWNDAAERVFGFAAGDAIGQTLDVIVPERFREAHWRGYDRALATGETKFRGQALPTRAQRADGGTIYVELTFAVVRAAEDGAVAGVLALARDITQRFEEQRALRRRALRLAELLAALGGDPADADAPPG